MKRALVLVLALAALVALLYGLRPAARQVRQEREAGPDAARGPHAEIDDASRAQLEQVLRDATREDAKRDGAKPR